MNYSGLGFVSPPKDVRHAKSDGDDEEDGERDMMDEWGRVHELVELRHSEDSQQQTKEVYSDVPKCLYQEEVDEKLYYFVICPFHLQSYFLFS